MSFCPLLRGPCRTDECAFWVSEGRKCAIYQIASGIKPLLANEIEDEFLKEKKRRINEVLSKLKKISIDELSKNLVEFAQKSCPNCWPIPNDVKTLFWTNMGITEDMFLDSYELELIREQVESKANLSLMPTTGRLEFYRDVPDTTVNLLSEKVEKPISADIKEKSVEDLAQEIVNFVKEEVPEAILSKERSSMILEEAFNVFWSERGVSKFVPLDPQLRLKIMRVEARAREIIASIRLSGENVETYESILQRIEDEPEKIATDILRSAEEKIWENPTLYLTLNSYEILREAEEEWLKKHGIPSGWRDIQLIDPEAWRKIEKARQIARAKIQELLNNLKIEREKEECQELFKKAIEWMKQRGITRTQFTKRKLESFLMEEGKTLSTRAKDYLYSLLKEKL